MAQPDEDQVYAEMERISAILEAAGHRFTQASAMATFCLGIRTLVGYGLQPPELTAMVIQVARAAYAESAAAVQAAGRLVDPQGRPL